jgi:hypothetical protein
MPFEDVLKLAAGDQLREQVQRFVESADDVRDRQPFETRVGGGHSLDAPGCIGELV